MPVRVQDSLDSYSGARQFADQVQSWANNAAQMKSAAMSGGFSVDPEAGRAYVALYDRCIDRIEKMRTDTHLTVQSYPLGSTPGAQALAPWNREVAQELQAALDQLGSVYGDARDAYAQAMRNYEAGEQEIVGGIGRAAGS